MTFALDSRLLADTLPIGDLGLSRLLLANDVRYSWLILVPRRSGLTEIVDLDPAGRAELMEEIARCCEALKRLVRPRKLNVGAIGNRVEQLHVHVVARFEEDTAWPDPVWGRGAAVPYGADLGRERIAAISTALGLL